MVNKNNYHYIGLVGAILMAIGNFLPFVKVTVTIFSKEVAFIEGDGTIVLVLAITAGVIMLFKKYLVSMIATSLALGITIYDMVNVSRLYDESNLSSYASVSTGIGAWMIIIGCVMVFIAGAMHFKCRKTNEWDEVIDRKKYCSSCGKQISEDANFCSGCGKEV